LFFFSSRRRHTTFSRDWSSDVCSSDLGVVAQAARVVVPDVAQLGILRPHLQELVDLLLVLDDRESDAGVPEDVDHLLGHRVLVEIGRASCRGGLLSCAAVLCMWEEDTV